VSHCQSDRVRRTLVLALLLEGGLGALALAIGWLVGVRTAAGLWLAGSPTDVLRQAGVGCLAVGPLLLVLVATEWLPIAALRRLKRLVQTQLVPHFRGFSWWQLALVSLAAGWGEELLFRGLIQDGLRQWLLAAGVPHTASELLALLVASALFGLAHCVSVDYLVLAAVVGVYLGVLFSRTENLLVPMVAHAGYDFLALVYLLRTAEKGQSGA
jgi:membrane protease YdiL (CAAX protease family)